MPTSKFCIRKLLLKIDARGLCEKNQKKCIDCLKNQDQIKMSLSVKNVVAINFICSMIKAPHL